MKFDKKSIVAHAHRTGWEADVLEKAVRLLALLEDIGAHPFLTGKLLLKGGTALNLFYLDVPRLSVDIDLNFIGATDREEMLRQRPEVDRAVSSVAAADEYDVSRSGDSHAGTKLYLHYTNVSGVRDRIEIDLNYLFRVPLRDFETRPSRPLLPDFRVSFPLVHWHELTAGKVLAAVERVAPRDLYDLAQLSMCMDTTERPFRAVFVGLSGVLLHPLHTYSVDRFSRIDARIMKAQVAPFLRTDEPVDFDMILSQARALATPLLNLTRDEMLYVNNIDKGHIRPECLAPEDPVLCDRLRNHPALLWKVQNVRQHLEK